MKIAHIDADPDIRTLVKLALTSLGGHEVRIYGSPREALARIPAERPDVVLLEALLPDMSGIELHDRLAGIAALEGTAFAFLTTQVFGTAGKDLEKIAPVISKPFDPCALPAQIRAVSEAAAWKAGRGQAFRVRASVAA